jgi:hypothetical protein
MITDKDKTGQITEFRITYKTWVVANEMFKAKKHFGYKNVSLTERNNGQWSVNWDAK